MKKLVSILVLLTIVAIGCDDNTGVNEQEVQQPEIPPVSTLAPDLSGITGSGTASSANSEVANLQAGDNFEAARQRAGVIGSFLGANVGFSASLIATAGSTKPEQVEENVWVWSFEHENPLTNGTLQSELTATVEILSSSVEWELLLNSSGTLIELEDFNILNGTSNLDGTNGTWDISVLAPKSGEQSLATKNEWVLDSDSTFTLNSTIALENSPLKDDSFEYVVEETTKELLFNDQSESTTVQIIWNPATGEGQLTAPNYNSGEPACWDSQKEDVDCELVRL